MVGCMVFRPIVELSTEHVWEFLSLYHPPWGGSHDKLIQLYRNAGGGECPVITQKSDAPSCGTSSSRFGCWTCTVVKKDRSLEGFVEAGFKEFGPLLDFRDWLTTIRNNCDKRQARRRNGHISFTDTGTFIPGPFTLAARAEILEKLQSLEKQTQKVLITQEEHDIIHTIWAREVASQAGISHAGIREVKKGK